MDAKTRDSREMPGLAIGNPAANWEDMVCWCRVLNFALFRVGARMRHGFILGGGGTQAILGEFLHELRRHFLIANDEVLVICDLTTEFLGARSIETFGEPEERMAFVAELACRLNRLRSEKKEAG